MATRYDVVLVTLPLLAVSGLAVETIAGALESIAGVGGTAADLPLAVGGAVAAAALVGHEIVVAPPTEDT
jgi:hypothetical protein